MAAVSDAITYARQKTQSDSNTLTDTNGLAWANGGLLDITRDLIERGVNAAQLKEAYATLSSTDTPPGKYVWPSDMWMLKTVEVDFTGTGGQNYLQAERVDLSNLQGSTSFDYVRLNQSTSEPLFTNWGNTGEVFPTPTTSALLRIIYFLAPTEYSSTSSTINYPQSLDYRSLGDKIIISYYESLERFDASAYWVGMYKQKINAAINIFAPQSQQPIKSQKLRMTGWNY